MPYSLGSPEIVWQQGEAPAAGLSKLCPAAGRPQQCLAAVMKSIATVSQASSSTSSNSTETNGSTTSINLPLSMRQPRD
jgi:hypothetical protein